MKKLFLLCFALLLLGFAAAPTSAASCCPALCQVNSDCDATCGPGFGQCVRVGSCCRVCLCSPGGT